MPTPAWLTQRHRRVRLRVEVAAAEARFATADFNEALAVSIESRELGLPLNVVCDVLRHDLGLFVGEHAGFGSGFPSANGIETTSPIA